MASTPWVLWLLLSLAIIAFLVLGGRNLIRACEAANEADWGGKWPNRLDGLNRIFCRRFHRLLTRKIALPATGGVLVAANHCSGLDPLLLIASCQRPLRFMIAREQYDRWWIYWLFKTLGMIPVERTTNSQRSLYVARAAVEAGEVIAVFPHGGIHKIGDPFRPKRGIAVLAGMTGAPIYPIRVSGIRAQGFTVFAVFIRSRARVEGGPPLYCKYGEAKACLLNLAGRLEAKG
ncbi:MAG TPA: 1-acyl-sn-glycerol-3-phosphate acyltransferase [Acidiferrobacteraceae bacterium]|nr:1-acyl-sn-glycerol-3-phosphate acyltransferase [Acidiferrobacteraceae bacterium]